MKRVSLALLVLIAAFAILFSGCDRGGGATTSGGPVTIKVEIFDRGMDGGRTSPTDNEWIKWVKAKVLADLNINVEFVSVGRWSEDTDITNLLASGDAPDLCYTYNTGMINTFALQGGILDLAPYIDRLLPDMKRLYGPDPALAGQDFIYRDRDPTTGRVFSVTSMVTRTSRTNVFIRKDWLDTLGLALPKTRQEFYNALVAFRDRDPGNVGRNNVIPFFTGDDVRWSLVSVAPAFIDPNLSARDEWVNIPWGDRPVLAPGYKEAVRWYNQWYNEGLFFRDFALMTSSDEANNIIKSGRVGAFTGNWDLPWRDAPHSLQGDLETNVPGGVWYPVDCMEDRNGVTRKEISDKPGLRIFVPAASKNPEAALQYLNWLCQYDNFHYLQVGELGRNHDLVNGVPRTLTMPAGHPWFMNSPNNIDMTMNLNGVEMRDPAVNARVLALGYGETDTELIVLADRISTTNGFVRTIFPATLTQMGVYSQILADKANALLAQAITASPSNFDSVWDAGVRDYLQSGGQEVIDERARAWAAGH